MEQAIIYCRVSSQKQAKEDTIASQKFACQEYAKRHDYKIVAEFIDDGLSGGTIERSGAQEMLQFMRTHKNQGFHLICYDLSRLARDVGVFSEIQHTYEECGFKLHYLSRDADNSPLGHFMDTIEAAVAQHFRENNALKTKESMQAQAKMGYYVFNPPKGYERTRDVAGHIYLKRKEPEATAIRSAFERYASGELLSQMDVLRFLQGTDGFLHNKLSKNFVKRLLTNRVYTGEFAYPKWEIGVQHWKMDVIVPSDLFEQTQYRLNHRMCLPRQKNVTDDFLLRGYVACSECGHPMSAGWSKGRNKKFPYYFCFNTKCPSCRKSISKEVMECDFSELLASVHAKPGLINLTKHIITDVLHSKKRENAQRLLKLESEKGEKIIKIQKTMDLLVATTDSTLVKVYNDCLKQTKEEQEAVELEIKKLKDMKLDTIDEFQKVFETVKPFIENPYKLWERGDTEQKKKVLKIVFGDNLKYGKETKFRTAQTSSIFELISVLASQKYQLATQNAVLLNQSIADVYNIASLLSYRDYYILNQKEGKAA